jgi:hypothetical protein
MAMAIDPTPLLPFSSICPAARPSRLNALIRQAKGCCFHYLWPIAPPLLPSHPRSIQFSFSLLSFQHILGENWQQQQCITLCILPYKHARKERQLIDGESEKNGGWEGDGDGDGFLPSWKYCRFMIGIKISLSLGMKGPSQSIPLFLPSTIHFVHL